MNLNFSEEEILFQNEVQAFLEKELTEDLTTGEKSIKIADEDMGKGSEMTFKPGEDIVDEKTGKINDANAMKFWSRNYEPGWEIKMK